jgi:hypothetical protein
MSYQDEIVEAFEAPRNAANALKQEHGDAADTIGMTLIGLAKGIEDALCVLSRQIDEAVKKK